MLCGALFGLPFLLLHSGATPASRGPATALARLRTHEHVAHKNGENPALHRGGVNLPSHLVAYQAPQSTTTTTPPPPTTTAAPAPPPTTTTTTAPPPPPTTTTTTDPPAPVNTNSEVGQATWYAEAPDGYCASPTLSFGTVLTVTNNGTGASTQCTVDDREAAGYPRVVDMSPEGFSQIADTGQGVVDVTISW
jgi:rare lipoprotein A (peptidoglycan hydrolase)